MMFFTRTPFPCVIFIYHMVSSCMSRVTSGLWPLFSPVATGPRGLADNSAPWRLRHVRLAGKRPRAQESHPRFVLLPPSAHPAGGREQTHVRVHVGHRVAPNAAGLLQVGLALLLHQRSQRRRVGRAVVLRDGDFRLGVVTRRAPRRPQEAGLCARRQDISQQAKTI